MFYEPANDPIIFYKRKGRKKIKMRRLSAYSKRNKPKIDPVAEGVYNPYED